MLNFKIIVVPTDLSDYSLRALPYAVGLAERFNAKLRVIHVHEPVTPISDAAWTAFDVAAADADLERDARAALEKLVREHVPPGVAADAIVVRGAGVESIVKYARDENADLLVMCTHGRTGLAHVLMGSTAEAVVRRAPCPVLTLRQPLHVEAVQR